MQPIETEGRAFDRVGISLSTSSATGEPIKVVSERLGHAHPGFTMDTYQHVMPGMGAGAAVAFAALLADARGDVRQRPAGPRRVVVFRRSTGQVTRTPRSQLRAGAVR